ncbi:hypothetical protein HJG60_010980 [Phyllostomus discolor]|uniref:Uncharacterized protein n=1 Tax=Phyllostomus discolor TaxID=89673 RepID=A0A834ECX4_9CHIR|nr:hypothetical protein HJG60_010980 [Phyllostomus discolor]
MGRTKGKCGGREWDFDCMMGGDLMASAVPAGRGPRHLHGGHRSGVSDRLSLLLSGPWRAAVLSIRASLGLPTNTVGLANGQWGSEVILLITSFLICSHWSLISNDAISHAWSKQALCSGML